MGRGPKRQKWSPEEDEKLIRYIKEHEEGTWDWVSLPEQAGLLRSAKSCNSRYNDYLRDDRKGGDFTRKEEDTIVRLHQSFGNSWAAIAKYLTGRSRIEIKNYWRHNLMNRVRYMMLPNLDNDDNKEKSRENESCASTGRIAIGEEVALSSTNLELFDLADVDMINNCLAENANLSSSGGTGGEDLAWSSTDFELYGCAEMGIFNSIPADDRNLNYGRDAEGLIGFVNSSSIAGEGLAYPGGSNWFGCEDRASTGRIAVGEEVALSSTSLELFDLADVDMINNSLAENANLSSSSGTGGEELAWSSTDFELYGCAEMGIFNSLPANDRNFNYGRNAEGSIGFVNITSIAGEELGYPGGSNWFGCEDRAMVNSSLDENDNNEASRRLMEVAIGELEQNSELVELYPELFNGDLEWYDGHVLDSYYGNLNEEGYFRRSMEIADPVRSDMPQGDMTVNMPTEMAQESDEIVKDLMAELQDDSVGGSDAQPPDGFDLVYAMFADCL